MTKGEFGTPCVKFHSENVHVRVYMVQERLSGIVDVYERAIPYFLQWKEDLVSHHGFSDLLPSSSTLSFHEDDALLMSVSSWDSDPASDSEPHSRLFILPESPQAFASYASKWAPAFTSLRVGQIPESGDLFLSEALPLQNIFYLLLSMFDGMLSLAMRVDNEHTICRVVPHKDWIQQNSDILKDVLDLSCTMELEEEAEGDGCFVKRKFGVDVDCECDYNRTGWDDNLEDVYERAKPYLLQWKKELISQHGYMEQLPVPSFCINEDDTLLMSLCTCSPASDSSSSHTEPLGRLFILPKSLQAFTSDATDWEPVFAPLYVIQSEESGRLFLDEVLPLQNIFYLLLTMFDGMLSLVIRADGVQAIRRRRVMPHKEWIHRNSDILKDVLGDEVFFKHKFVDNGDAYKSRNWDSDNYYCRVWDEDFYNDDLYGRGWYDDEDHEDLDFTACSLDDCGYCGKGYFASAFSASEALCTRLLRVWARGREAGSLLYCQLHLAA